MKKLLFIYNPNSGTGEICKKIADVLDIFTQAGYEVVAYPTQASGDGTEKVREEGCDFDRIVVAGGDGMLNELVNAVMALPKQVTVGYLPTGTVNDFATTHKIPKNNAVEAAKIAASDNVKSVDLGKFGDKYFSYVAAFGLVTSVAYDTPQKIKKRWKVLAYVLRALKQIRPNMFKKASKRVTIQTESVSITGDFIFGAISNSLSIGGMKNLIEKSSKMDDGLLEGLFIPKPKGLRQWNKLLKSLITRDFSSSVTTFVRAKHFYIKSEKAGWTLDGENGGEHEEIEVSAQKQVLKIVLPEEDTNCS